MSPPAVTEVGVRRRKGRLRGAFVTALRSTSVVDSVLVEVRADDGTVGWGEATPVTAVTGETLDSVERTLTVSLAGAVVGVDADDLDAALDALHRHAPGDPSARAGLDLALHDLAARRRGVALWELLGGPGRVSRDRRRWVATDVTISAGTPEEMVAATRPCLADGFGVLKLKVGDGTADDLERVTAVAGAVGPGVTLRLDANQGWSPDEAVRVLGGLADRGIAIGLVEQPVPADDLDALARVTARVDVPVLADEAVWTAADVTAVAERGAADLVNLKLMKCGGLGPARQAVAAAASAGLGWMMGCMMERAPGVVAAAALAATGPAGVVHDLDAAWWQADSELTYRHGRLRLPAGPGLGEAVPADGGGPDR